MAITKSTRVVSRAGKAKNRKWDAQQRFSAGHDGAAMALLPENLRIPRRGGGIRVFRGATFGMSRAERVYADANHLIDCGLVESAEEAVDVAVAALDATAERRSGEVNELADYEPWRKGAR